MTFIVNLILLWLMNQSAYAFSGRAYTWQFCPDCAKLRNGFAATFYCNLYNP